MSTVVKTMNGYTKLFGSILASTIWEESKETRVCWITMLAMADKFGMVSSSIPGLATLARLTVEETEAALSKLQSVDQYSRTKDFDGRRIEPCAGGWLILNYAKYREKANEDERREYLAEAKRRSRERMSTDVNTCQQSQQKSTQAEAEAEAEEKEKGASAPKEKAKFVKPTIEEVAAYCRERRNGVPPQDWYDHYESNGWKVGKNAMKNWKAAVRTWEKNYKPPSSRVPTDEDLANWNPVDGGLGDDR